MTNSNQEGYMPELKTIQQLRDHVFNVIVTYTSGTIRVFTYCQKSDAEDFKDVVQADIERGRHNVKSVQLEESTLL